MYLQSVSGEMLLPPSVLILLYVEISLSTSADCGFAAIVLARATCNDFIEFLHFVMQTGWLSLFLMVKCSTH